MVAELSMVGRLKAELISKKKSNATRQIPTAQDIIILLPNRSGKDQQLHQDNPSDPSFSVNTLAT